MTDRLPDSAAATTRLPSLRPEDLSERQRELYDSIVGGPRGGGAFSLTDDDGRLQGPFGGFLLSPALGDALQQVGAAIRYRSSLCPRVRELAILAVAAKHDSAFEKYAHQAVGRTVGLTEAEMETIDRGRSPELSDPIEAAGVALTHALLTGDVDDFTWETCVGSLGLEAAYELLVLVGYYSTLALQMRVLRVDRIPDRR